MGNERVNIILRTCGGREAYRDYLIRCIPGLIVVQDTTQNAMDTFLEALRVAGNDPAVHIEDDIILTSHFCEKLQSAIAERPGEVIQFFSMRKADIEIGSRYDSGRTFMMNQCFYLPAKYSAWIMEYYRVWSRKETHPTGYDILIADWLKSRKEKYYIYVPSLVQHRKCKSLINPRRGNNRQSLTFRE